MRALFSLKSIIYHHLPTKACSSKYFTAARCLGESPESVLKFSRPMLRPRSLTLHLVPAHSSCVWHEHRDEMWCEEFCIYGRGAMVTVRCVINIFITLSLPCCSSFALVHTGRWEEVRYAPGILDDDPTVMCTMRTESLPLWWQFFFSYLSFTTPYDSGCEYQDVVYEASDCRPISPWWLHSFSFL